MISRARRRSHAPHSSVRVPSAPVNAGIIYSCVRVIRQRGALGNCHHRALERYQPACFEGAQGARNGFPRSADELADLFMSHREAEARPPHSVVCPLSLQSRSKRASFSGAVAESPTVRSWSHACVTCRLAPRSPPGSLRMALPENCESRGGQYVATLAGKRVSAVTS